jgi:LacI family transcriptional regulator
MRHRGKPPEPLHVAVFLDSAGSYGRGLLEGIADYLEVGGPWSVFVESHATGGFDTGWVRRWHGDGILAFIEDRKATARLYQLRIPVVETYGHLAELQIPRVGNDEAAIGRVAADHLLDRRFRHFVFSGYLGHTWVEGRRRGFAEAVARAGFTCDSWDAPRSFSSLHSWENAQNALTMRLRRQPRPLGVMACSDRHAQSVLDACRRAELRVPDDVAVIGTDNDAAICRLSQPPLSSVADNPRRIGFEAARLLERIIRKKANPAGRRHILVPPLGVVTRRSTETTVTDDELVAAALRFIREHACGDIDANTVWRRFSLSRSAFYRRFREALGRSPHEEILRTRMDRVRELLVDSRLSIAEVARLAGFEHPEYLGAVFKRRTGLTPGQYRAQHKAT